MVSLIESDQRFHHGGSDDHFSPPFSVAFQPIVDLERSEVFSFEALARGPEGESAASVFSRVSKTHEYAFDNDCRVRAIQLANRLDMRTRLNLNFLPNAIYYPGACIQTTLRNAAQLRFPIERMIFEFTESEPIPDVARLAAMIREYQHLGLRTAIDDFGAGYAGLGLLADLQPDLVKIDIGLTRDIDTDRIRRVIVEGIVATCRTHLIGVIAEGVETVDEMYALLDLGVRYFQGYLFARPGFEMLPQVLWPHGFEPRRHNESPSSQWDTKVDGPTRLK